MKLMAMIALVPGWCVQFVGNKQNKWGKRAWSIRMRHSPDMFHSQKQKNLWFGTSNADTSSLRDL